MSPQPASLERNGFVALAVFDSRAAGGNRDGQIDSRDAIFISLRLWQDVNHNGKSEPSELHRLDTLGLRAISLDYHDSRRTDRYGNRFRYKAKIEHQRNATISRWAWDVIPTVNPPR